MEKFSYDLSWIDFKRVNSKKDLLILMNEHDKNSLIFCYHTGLLNAAIGKTLGIEGESLNLLYQSGLFHDAGKLGMSSSFLNYEGAYTIKMYNEMKKHATGGAHVLEKLNVEHQLIEASKYHHCNFDGTGYPGGLYHKEIPLFARITRASDSIDAYMSKRCYKEGGPARGAFDDLNQYNGTSYDPEVLEAFSDVHKKVMKRCHELGMDQPSQFVYMNQVEELTVPEFHNKYVEGLI